MPFYNVHHGFMNHVSLRFCLKIICLVCINQFELVFVY